MSSCRSKDRGQVTVKGQRSGDCQRTEVRWLNLGDLHIGQVTVWQEFWMQMPFVKPVCVWDQTFIGSRDETTWLVCINHTIKFKGMYELNIFWILWINYVHIMNGKKACKWNADLGRQCSILYFKICNGFVLFTNISDTIINGKWRLLVQKIVYLFLREDM